MELLLISWRNLFRHPRRSILTLMIIMIGSVGLVIVGGLFTNLFDGFREVFIHGQTGHMQLSVKGYSERGEAEPFNYLIGNAEDLQTSIQTSSLVAYTVPRLRLGGMLASTSSSAAVIALGVDPVRESEMGNFRTSERNAPSTTIVAGEDLSTNDPRGVLLGKGLVKVLNLQIGSPISFLTTREGGSVDGADYHLRGVFETYVKDFDDHVMKVNLGGLQELLGTKGQIHNLIIMLKSSDDMDPARKEIMDTVLKNHPNLELGIWEDQAFFYKRTKAMLNKLYIFIQFVIGITVFLSIANTVNMAIYERVREFGILMAIGTERKMIFQLILLETSILSVAGSLLGIGAGAVASHMISYIGIDFVPPISTNNYIAGITLSSPLLIKTFVLTLCSAILSSLIPAYRASHLPLTEALVHV